MTSRRQFEPVLAWDEPYGLAPRGTVIVVPGRGERPGVYERFGRRIAADAYRVRVVGDATEDVDEVGRRIRDLLAAPYTVGPVVLVGSDTGALMALRTIATTTTGGPVDIAGLVLAGLPDPDRRTTVTEEAEPELRASCPTHQKLLADTDRDLFLAGTLTADRVPEALRDPIDLAEVSVPVLAVHGSNDQVSPLGPAARRYLGLPRVQLAAIEDGRHDVLNAAHHRTVAATVVRFLEQLRLGADAGPIVCEVDLGSLDSDPADVAGLLDSPCLRAGDRQDRELSPT